MKLGKIAASALFAASMLTFGVADPVLDATPVAYANSQECMLEDVFAQIWDGDTNYTISSLEFGTASPYRDFDPQPYIQDLMSDGFFEEVRNWNAPDGQYVVFDVPGYGAHYEFFFGKDGNYVRQNINGDQAVFHYVGNAKAVDVMKNWGKQMKNRGRW